MPAEHTEHSEHGEYTPPAFTFSLRGSQSARGAYSLEAPDAAIVVLHKRVGQSELMRVSAQVAYHPQLIKGLNGVVLAPALVNPVEVLRACLIFGTEHKRPL